MVMNGSVNRGIHLNEIPDPRMLVRSTDEEGIGGRFRVRPEEFVVNELDLFTPSGSGEHLYLRIQKKGISHREMIRRLRKLFNVPEKAIGYAGMKDRNAITSQTVSVHTDKECPQDLFEESRLMEESGLMAEWSVRHSHKLRRGNLKGNHFVIYIRDVNEFQIQKVQRILQVLSRDGLPNAYMSQRFGYRLNNHRLGVALLEERWEDLLHEWLGTGGSEYPQHESTFRAHFARENYEDAIKGWRKGTAEYAALLQLKNGASSKVACDAVPGKIRELWIDAVQAAIFNQVLGNRLQNGTMSRMLPGDIAWNHASSRHGKHQWSQEETQDPVKLQAIENIEISATGPLPGRRMSPPGEDIQSLESLAAEQAKVDESLLQNEGDGRRGDRRPLRVPVRNPQVLSGRDESYGPYIKISFELPKGAYATGVLSEIMGTEAVEERGWLPASR